MPTLVRVRGKRKPSWAAAATKEKTRKQPASHREDAIMSQLELLPNEILQEIFILCQNFALPRSSSMLYDKLTSDHIKRQLVWRYLTRMRQDYLPAWELIPERNQELESEQEREQEDASQIQASILQAPWMNLAFLQDCQLRYYIRKGTKQLRYFLRRLAESDREEAMEDLRRCIAAYFGRSETSPEKYSFTRDDGAVFECFPTSELGEYAELRIKIEEGTSNDAPNEQQGGTSTITFLLPAWAYSCMLSPKLLQRPWTQGNGDFLKMVIDCKILRTRGHNRIIPEMVFNNENDALDDALSSAIKENSVPAIALLAHGPTYQSSAGDLFWKDFCLVESRQENEISFKRLQDSSEQQPKAISSKESTRTPWRIVKGSPYATQNYGCEVREHHLEMSLQAAITQNDPNFVLFKWLASKAFIATSGRGVRDTSQRTCSDTHRTTKLLSRHLTSDENGEIVDNVYYKAWRWVQGNRAVDDPFREA